MGREAYFSRPASIFPRRCPAIGSRRNPDAAMLDLRSLNPIVLNEAHRGDLVDHLLLLPEEQRYTRFIGVMTDGAIQAFAARIDFARELLVGLPDPAGGFLGVVQAS